MAVSAQPTEWSLDTGISHNKENILIVSDRHAEVEFDKIVAPLLGKGSDEDRAESSVFNASYSYPEEELKRAIKDRHSRTLAITFVLMTIISVGNKVFQKLQTVPFHNYPTFVNLFTGFVFILVSFAYIIPVQRKGVSITPDQVAIPNRVFIIMGALDGVAGILQVFAATYLNGSVLILLSQSTIPIAILLSIYILKKKYSRMQLIGACIVAVGILIVIGPTLRNGGSSTLLWSMILIFSCIPMVLCLNLNTHRALHTTSSIYKEIVLGQKEMDAIYLLGWTTVYQFLINIPLTLPVAELGDPRIPPSKLPENLWGGLKCFVGVNTVTNGIYPDDCWPGALTFFTSYMIFNIVYNILIVYMLKFGSATSLYLAITISVPIGNMVFALPFVPGHTPIHVTDIVGMVCIFIGLLQYRLAQNKVDLNEDGTGLSPLLLHPLLELGDQQSCEDIDCSINTNDGAPESAKNPTKDDSDDPEYVDL